MTPNFINQYHPLTARPFRRNRTYEEQIPCKPLQPYVSCFWSSEGIEKSGADGLIRVIPDTCMDIIIEINYTKQTIKSCLCGIQDYAVMMEQGKEKEMTANPSIAVCAGNFYFTGKAKPLGSVYDDTNAEIKAAYIARYPDSFGKEDEFIQSDEMFFELTMETVSEWVFAGGNPTSFAEQHFSPEAFEQ